MCCKLSRDCFFSGWFFGMLLNKTTSNVNSFSVLPNYSYSLIHFPFLFEGFVVYSFFLYYFPFWFFFFPFFSDCYKYIVYIESRGGWGQGGARKVLKEDTWRYTQKYSWYDYDYFFLYLPESLEYIQYYNLRNQINLRLRQTG